MTESDEPGLRARGKGGAAPHAGSVSEPLDARVRAIVKAAPLGDTFQALFGIGLLDCALGWPRLLVSQPASVAGADAAFLRAGDVMIELTRAAADPTSSLGLSLSADGAALLVDALLGGRVASGVASASGQPSEAECGVLAYAVARLLAASQQPWLVRDVRASQGSSGLAAPAVVWPIALSTSSATLEGALWLSRAVLEPLSQRHLLEVSLVDRVAPGRLELAIGETWLCEGSGMTWTSDGLTGPVTLSLVGTSLRRQAQLRRNRVRLRAEHGAELGAADADTIELVLGERALSLLELAELASGESTEVDCTGRASARLRRAGRTLAEGRLISWRGTLGLQIEVLVDASDAQASDSTAESTSSKT